MATIEFGSFGSGNGQFSTPMGVFVDVNNIYVADMYNHRIQVFARATNTFIAAFGSVGDGSGQFSFPKKVVADTSFIYVLDVNNSRIQIFNINTYAYVGQFGSNGDTDGHFNGLYDIAVDGNKIYVSDTAGGGSEVSRVQIFDKTTYAFIDKFGVHGYKYDGNFVEGRIGLQCALSIDTENIYLGDWQNQWISIFDKTTYAYKGKFLTMGNALGAVQNIWSLVVDSNLVYVLNIDATHAEVITVDKITHLGIKTIGPGTLGTGLGQLQYPADLSVYGGKIYIADGSRQKIVIYTESDFPLLAPSIPSGVSMGINFTITPPLLGNPVSYTLSITPGDIISNGTSTSIDLSALGLSNGVYSGILSASNIVGASGDSTAIPIKYLNIVNPIIWQGYTFTFTKIDYANWLLPENQDTITSSVVLTRKNSQGLFNTVYESAFDNSLGIESPCPTNTLWAFEGFNGNPTGSNFNITNYNNLLFSGWTQACGYAPPDVVNANGIVLDVISNTLFEIKMLEWTPSNAGGFSYIRSSAPVQDSGDSGQLTLREDYFN